MVGEIFVPLPDALRAKGETCGTLAAGAVSFQEYYTGGQVFFSVSATFANFLFQMARNLFCIIYFSFSSSFSVSLTFERPLERCDLVSTLF